MVVSNSLDSLITDTFSTFFQAKLLLKSPIENPLLSYIYNEQQQRFNLIADEIMEIQQNMEVNYGFFSFLLSFPKYLPQEYKQCDTPVSTCIDDNTISSIVKVNVPSDIAQFVTVLPSECIVKLRCYLGYSEKSHALQLTCQSINTVSKFKVAVT